MKIPEGKFELGTFGWAVLPGRNEWDVIPVQMCVISWDGEQISYDVLSATGRAWCCQDNLFATRTLAATEAANRSMDVTE